MKNLTLKSYHTSEIPKIAETETRIWGTSTFFMTIYSCANIYSIGKKNHFSLAREQVVAQHARERAQEFFC